MKGDRSPYDGNWIYWGNRMKLLPDKQPRVINLLKIQKSKCRYCNLYFKKEDRIEVHHRDQNRKKNLDLVHGHCHDAIHRKSA